MIGNDPRYRFEPITTKNLGRNLLKYARGKYTGGCTPAPSAAIAANFAEVKITPRQEGAFEGKGFNHVRNRFSRTQRAQAKANQVATASSQRKAHAAARRERQASLKESKANA